MNKCNFLVVALLFAATSSLHAQNNAVKLVRDKTNPAVHVTINGKHFTDFFFPDTIAKPVLYPIKAPNGTVITRGFPMNPIAGEPTDHPHHLGLWFNYGDVNGLDFWNNSYDIPADKKNLYGTVKFGKITSMQSGATGKLSYDAIWHDQSGKTHLTEQTGFEFSEINGVWVIDRTTTLTAAIPVVMKDNKEGVLGLRMAHELQIPAKTTKKFVDANGIETTIKAVTDTIANGNYINSNGVQGEDVWSRKASWCMMYAKMKTDSISILIIDHPKNIGYPTYWHARGYGLFAANPLGDKVFTNGKAERNLSLKAGESVTFRYRVAIAAGKTALPNSGITQLQNDFASKPVKLMYVGSYTGKGNPGIQVYAFDQATGKSSLVREHRNPSAGYFAITPDKKILYSLGEEGSRKGAVWAYSIDPKTGDLIKLNSQPTIGDGPCYISFDPKTKTVYCANYSGGSLTVFKTAENGSLLPAAQHIVYNGSSVNKSRQDKAHAHCAVIAPGGKYVYVNDLGADKIYRHTIKADGTLEETPLAYSTEPGNGPRHIVFNKLGDRAYSINEMKGTVDAFVVEEAGLKKIQTIIADTVQTNGDHGSGAIHLSPDGRWLIGSNRITSNQVVVYKVLADGKLEKKSHTDVVKKPRFFRFDETGKFVLVAGQDGDKVQVFAFDGKTGALKNTGNDLEILTPVAIEFY